MAGGSGEAINDDGWADDRLDLVDDLRTVGLTVGEVGPPEPDFLAGYEDRTCQAQHDRTHEPITLGELLRTLTAWAEANGGLEGPTLEVARDKSLEGALRVSVVHAANLVDVLSDYIHGNYLPGDGNGQPRDEAGHPVVEL